MNIIKRTHTLPDAKTRNGWTVYIQQFKPLTKAGAPNQRHAWRATGKELHVNTDGRRRIYRHGAMILGQF